MFIVFFVFGVCLFLFVFYNVHYMLLLLLLEGILLSVLTYFCFYILSSYGTVGLFLFLLLMVCMGGFSISLLVSLSRFLGRDFWCFIFIF